MTLLHFNPWALLLASLIQWFLGALWFSPLLFVKSWKALVGLKENERPKSGRYGMVISLIASFVITLALAHLILLSKASNVGCGALIGALAWLGFYAAPYYSLSLFQDTPFKLIAINAGYWLVGMVISGGLLAVWR